ncbi:peroxisomal testis-specific protein 1 isoform X1 [Psammomys obesus]|uniref:peroxisomal testis-specific protein 1 isoform X1 n=1 Tax=Psammomys obesus TaxID=48139 RepID=UPI0024535EB0|nr:peroxisomal testis-specific protein 1 isoform X1 [Psammomys obesus]
MPRNPGHSPVSQPKESDSGRNRHHHQPEEIQELTMQLRHIGDSVNRGMIQEVWLLCLLDSFFLKPVEPILPLKFPLASPEPIPEARPTDNSPAPCSLGASCLPSKPTF